MQKKIFQERLFDSLKRFAGHTAVECGTGKMTYAELDERSDRAARWILDRGIPKGTFIGILTENRLELVVILTGVMKAGCVIVPLYAGYPDKRTAEMIRATNLQYIFCDEANARRFTGEQEMDGQRTEFIIYRDIEEAQGSVGIGKLEFGDVAYDPEAPLYIHFTSGTTGVPKAILGKNKSLLQFLEWEIDAFSIDSDYRVAQLSIPGFDPLLRDIFTALFTGGVLCIPGNKDIVLIAEELKEWVDRQGIALIHCVSSLFRLLSSPPLDAGRFKALKYIIMAGEKISPAELRDWYETFGERTGLANCYGTSETTMFKTCYLIRQTDVDKERIPVGKPIRGARIIILDSRMNVCEELEPGEIYIRTPYMSCGYYNDPRLNEAAFTANPFGTDPGDLLHKTGDRGMFLPDGNIEFLGRLDRQLKIRGNRIEPEEIESILTRYPGIEEAVVTKKEAGKNELLAAYIAGNGNKAAGEASPPSLEDFLEERLPAYMIPAHIVELKKIPRTVHGKIDYSALPDPLKEEESDFMPPRDETERKLAEIWSDILGLENISVNSNFFKIGGNSLNLMTLTYRVHKAFDVRISLGEIFKNATIARQAELVRGVERTEFTGILPTGKKSCYVLSAAQKRMYILNGLERGSTNYNLSMVTMLTGRIDVERVQGAFRKLIDRHESLRTSFHLMDGEPVQKIHAPEDTDFKIEYLEAGIRDQGLGISVGARRAVPSEHASGGPLFEKSGAKTFDDGQEPGSNVGARRAVPETDRRDLIYQIHRTAATQHLASQEPEFNVAVPEIIDSFIRPFDLTKAPLLRVGLIPLEEERHIFMVDMHHIISDGTSLGLFRREFMALHAGEELPPLSIHYKDYAEWQNSAGQKERIRLQEEYWVEQFAEGVPILELPTDYPRPPQKSTEGSIIFFYIDGKETAVLNRMALEHETTMYTVLLAVYYVFLAKLSGGEDIVVGTPTAGRVHADLESIIGMFVNTLSIRNYPKKEKSFREFLQEVKTRTLAAFENQDYQFEDLIEKLDLKRDMSRSPLFDVMFSLQNMELTEIEIPGLKLNPYEHENKTAKFDLMLMGYEVEDRLRFSIEYSTKLFKKESIERFIGYFKDIVIAAAEDIDVRLLDINLAGHLTDQKPEISQEIRGDFDF